jgi:hypothetical protein
MTESPIGARPTFDQYGLGARTRQKKLTPHLRVMTLDLSDEETAALLGEQLDRYPFSPRIRTLTAIRDKIRPPPMREPLPPPKVYAPPSKGRYGRPAPALIPPPMGVTPVAMVEARPATASAQRLVRAPCPA